MARKKRNNQGKEYGDITNHNKTRLWPDLPSPVVISIRNQFDILKHLYFGGICKKWRAATRKCIKARPYPGLALTNHESSGMRNLLSFPWCKWYQPKESKNSLKYCIGSSYGWLVMKEVVPVREGEPCLLTISDPIFGNRYVYPLWDSRISFKHIILSPSPNTHFPTLRPIILTGGSNSGFLVYRNGFWNEEFCNIIDPSTPSEPYYLQLTNAIAIEGKIYALSLQGTLAQLNPDSSPRVSILGKNRAIPSKQCRCFRGYLIERVGEILVIFLISRGSINMVDDIEVFHFEFGSSSWVRKKSLGDQVLFIGLTCSMSLSAIQLGYRGNCIIFTQHAKDGWWVFSMEDGSVRQ